MTRVFENLSLIKPDGEKSSTNGSKIIAFISAVSTICVSPSKLFKSVFWIVILCARSTLAFKNAMIK